MTTSKPSKGRQIHSVSDITREVKNLLERGFSGIWVEGEISNFTPARSGHWYFTVKDENAQLSVVMFRRQNQSVASVPREGARVLLHGRINVYEPRGSYQLVADSLEDRGEGRLRARFEELKNRLAEEGLFDPELKRPLPMLPRRIALVTSPEGAAVRDMIRVILRRQPQTALLVVPSLVQGEKAPLELCTALERAGRLEDVDLIIIGRGGGSIEDIWAFNSEALARTIRACPKPVISAVGHEVDYTIADFAADVRAATPSMAGELAVPELREIQESLSGLTWSLQRAITHQIMSARLDLKTLAARLQSPERQMTDRRLRLDAAIHRLSLAVSHSIRNAHSTLDTRRLELAENHPGRRFERSRFEFNILSGRLSAAMTAVTEKKRDRLGRLALKLDALSPLSVLSRGYALVSDVDGQIVRSTDTLSPGDKIRARLAKGEFEADVSKVKN